MLAGQRARCEGMPDASLGKGRGGSGDAPLPATRVGLGHLIPPHPQPRPANGLGSLLACIACIRTHLPFGRMVIACGRRLPLPEHPGRRGAPSRLGPCVRGGGGADRRQARAAQPPQNGLCPLPPFVQHQDALSRARRLGWGAHDSCCAATLMARVVGTATPAKTGGGGLVHESFCPAKFSTA